MAISSPYYDVSKRAGQVMLVIVTIHFTLTSYYLWLQAFRVIIPIVPMFILACYMQHLVFENTQISLQNSKDLAMEFKKLQVFV